MRAPRELVFEELVNGTFDLAPQPAHARLVVLAVVGAVAGGDGLPEDEALKRSSDPRLASGTIGAWLRSAARTKP